MRNNKLLNSSVNKTFDEVLAMDKEQFREWVIQLRKTVVDLWDNYGLPPKVGYDEDEIIDAFRKMAAYPVHTLEVEKDVIRNTTNFSGYVNEWFPTMMKTKISYSSKGEPRSIYDYFSNPELLETFITYASRHFKRDSFYHYSSPISEGDILELGGTPYRVTTPEEFRDWFEKEIFSRKEYDYWLCPVKEEKSYTGYNQELSKKRNLIVDADFDAPKRCRTNVDLERSNTYSIRLYKKGQKLFPLGLKAFRISFCQYAVNFPPLTARYLYERFTKDIKDQDQIVIFDPSAGWGGRLLGAMSVNNTRNIHYVGTDPNTDHNLPGGSTKYHDVANFFNKHVRQSGSLFPKSHTYEIFQKGSEVIGSDPGFQKYKGKVDLVFTSPPYFNKEVYSQDKEQSCHKFSQYTEWKEGFLRPTLETCVEYLRRDRYLLWNISNIDIDGKTLPLEEDSSEILTSLGMKYITTIKMTLAAMPGGNRFIDSGKKILVKKNTVYGIQEEEESVYEGKMRHWVEVKSAKGPPLKLKFEPITVWYKE